MACSSSSFVVVVAASSSSSSWCCANLHAAVLRLLYRLLKKCVADNESNNVGRMHDNQFFAAVVVGRMTNLLVVGLIGL